MIKYIQDLLYIKKFTIKGAKQHLKDEYSKDNISNEVKTIKLNSGIPKSDLVNIRKTLLDIIKIVDKYKD